MKKLRQKEVKEYVKGQAASNCGKKKSSGITLSTQQQENFQWLQIRAL